VLISVSSALSPQPDTGLHCEITDKGQVHRVVSGYVQAFAGTQCAYTHRGLARLSWPGTVYRKSICRKRRKCVYSGYIPLFVISPALVLAHAAPL